MIPEVVIFWFRRDLRLHDNAGLYHALKSGYKVVPVFIFDTEILDKLEDKQDRRVAFIHDTLKGMQRRMEAMGSTLHVLHGKPAQCYEQLLKSYKIAAVYTNRDYEPAACERDEQIRALLAKHGVPLKTYKDQVIFEKGEVVKENGDPYTVYTPYSKRWKEKLSTFYLQSYPVRKYEWAYLKQPAIPMPGLEEMGFSYAAYTVPPTTLDTEVAKTYNTTRDYPAIKGTTRLSVHLRFGTVSIRELARDAAQLNGTLLNELIWREFYMSILWHFPHVVQGSFKKEYDLVRWRNNEEEFAQWCTGNTGYPIVDAGMRELNTTGYMHNRVRMIVASFLTKDLLIDWRWGEAYFAAKLMDYDLAANNGGWQWAAGTGCDAAPYFRVFNPYLQTQKFDPELKYVRKWVPEVDSLKYARPIVAHDAARLRCLEAYKLALNASGR